MKNRRIALTYGGLCCLAALAWAGADQQTTVAEGQLARGSPVPINPAALEKAGTGADMIRAAAGGQSCHYDNLPSDLGGTFATQRDPVFPFWAEFADDFVLTDPDDPDGQNDCILDMVQTGFAFFNCGDQDGDGDNDEDDCALAGVTPDTCWSGVKLTIYEDITAGTPIGDPNCGSPDKSPGGYPLDAPPDAHVSCIDPSGIVCELEVPMASVVTTLDPDTGPASYLTDLVDLGQFECTLQKNRKYWIAMSPIQEFGVCAQTSVYGNSNIVDHEGQLSFLFLGIPWTPGTDLGTTTDIAMAIWADKVLPPPTGTCLDIKPGSCPNPFNPVSQGYVPMALTGSDGFDVTQVDPSTLQLERVDGMGGSVAPNMGPPGPGISVEDVATPICQPLLAANGCVGDLISCNVDPATIVPGVSVACQAGGITTDNQWYRHFIMADFGLPDEYDVSCVEFGIEVLTGTQTVTVNLYDIAPGAFPAPTPLPNLIGTASVDLADQAETFVTVPVAASGTSGGLVVEVAAIDCLNEGTCTSFFIGANDLGQTCPSYISAPDCGLPDPAPLDAIGFPNDHVLINAFVSPAGGPPPEECECTEEGADGFDDLVMHFSTPDMADALQLAGLPGGTEVPLQLSGALLDGTPFSAVDCIVIVPVGGNGEVAATADDADIVLYPPDLFGNDGGTADMQLWYEPGTAVTMTAPLITPTGAVFHRWVVNGKAHDPLVTSIEVFFNDWDTTIDAQAEYFRFHSRGPDVSP